MELIVENIRFLNSSLGETIPTDWPIDNVGEVVDVEIDVRTDGSYVIATTDDPDDLDLVSIVTNPSNTRTGVIEDIRLIWTNSPFGFQGLSEGDEITLTGTIASVPFSGTRIIESIEASNLIKVTAAFSGSSSEIVFDADSIIYNSTKIESMEFSHGLIANNEVFNTESKTNGKDQRAVIENIDNTVLVNSLMDQLGDKSGHYGTIQVKGNGIGEGPLSPQVSQAFTISHKLLISPLFTSDQNDNDNAGIAPPYLEDDLSLKYVFEIAISKDLSDPNRKKTVISGERLGNIGWLDENFNTGSTDYFVTNVSYTRADLTTIESLELKTSEVTLKFNLNNTETSPFSDGDTKFVLSHWYKPSSDDLYRLPQFPNPSNAYPSRDRVLKENFFFDRIECLLGTPSTLSDNNGGVDQIIKDCSVVYISNSQVEVTATIAMSSTSVLRILEAGLGAYKFSISTKDYTKSRAKSDKANVTIDNNVYFTESTDPSMVEFDITHIDITSADVDNGYESLVVRSEDNVLSIAKFTIDRNDIPNFERVGTEVRLLNVKMQMIARKDIDTYFVLDKYSRSLPGTVVNNATYGNIPFIDISEDMGFITPPDDLRRDVRLRRRVDLDNAGKFSFEFRLPWVFRWEYFIENVNVDDEFFDVSQPFNGKNHDWDRFLNGTGWNLFFRIDLALLKDGVPQTYTKESQLIAEDYDEGIEWDTPVFKTIKASTGVEITNGSTYGIDKDSDTKVEMNMTFNTAPLPTLPDIELVMMIAVFEKTNYKDQFRFYTAYPAAINNVWTGITGGNFVTDTIEAVTTFRAAGVLKSALLPVGDQYRLSYRIYDKRADLGDPSGMATEDSVLMETESGIIMDVETI